MKTKNALARTPPMARRIPYKDHDETDPYPFGIVDGKGFSPTQVGLAEAFTRGPGGDRKKTHHMRFIQGFGWRVYDPNQGIWRARSTEYIRGMVLEFVSLMRTKANQLEKDKLDMHTDEKTVHLSEMNANLLAFLRGTARQTATIKNAVEALEALHACKYDTTADTFDADPTILTFKNVTIHIDPKNGSIESTGHNPKWMTTRRIPFDWKQRAKCPEWIKGLERMYVNPETQEPDRETIRYIQKLLGYALTASRQLELVVFFDGAGANGKSQFLKALMRLFGGGDCGMAVVTDADILLASKDPEAFLRAMAELAGSRLALADEMDTRNPISESAFKKLTIPEMKVTQKYRNFYDVKLHFTPLIFVNEVPPFKDLSDGMARRLAIIPHFASFSHKGAQRGAFSSAIIHDPAKTVNNYGDYIVNKEGEGILAWLIDGMIGYYKEGLEPSPAIDKRTKQALEVATAGTPVEFVDAMLTKTPGCYVKASVVYALYKKWYESIEGHGGNSKFVLSPQNFKRSLERMQIPKVRKRLEKGAQPSWVFAGVAIDEVAKAGLDKSVLVERVSEMTSKISKGAN